MIPGRPPTVDHLLAVAMASLDDDKADNVVVIDLAGKTDICDYMVIASGGSPRQIAAMTDHLREKFKSEGIASLSVEGVPHCDWVLIDTGDIVIHLFRPEVRAFYSLERMWAPASVPVDETAAAGADLPV